MTPADDKDDKEKETITSKQTRQRKMLRNRNSPGLEVLKNDCLEIMKENDLSIITMKDVIELVSRKYPQSNMEKRRSDLKKIIKDLLLSDEL